MPFERVPCFLGRGRCGADRPADPLRSGAQVHTLNQTDRFVEVIDSLLKLLMPGVPLRELEFCADSLKQHQKHPFSARLLLDRELYQGCRQVRPDDQLGFCPLGKLVRPYSGFKIHTNTGTRSYKKY